MEEFATRIRRKRGLRFAVKEALDTLPSAVCYFTETGAVKLCNTAMYDLVRTIAKNDLQSFSELEEALASCTESTEVTRDGNVFLFPDGRAWNYSARKVATQQGEVFTEAVLSDVTELYEKQQELKRQSQELKEMYRELKTLSENVLEMTREQEMISLKLRLHDQMNMGVAAIRQILRQDAASEEGTAADAAAALAQFRRAMQVLQEENAYPQDDVADFIRDANVSGIHVEIEGELPEGKLLHFFLPVMREACVNAARHADATRLRVAVTQAKDSATLIITNNGKQPKQEVVPRGGLADLGKEIACAGGTLEVAWQPEFSLKVSLPVNGH